jgi:hypothetical protein
MCSDPVDPVRRHIRPSRNVEFRDGGTPRTEERRIRRGQIQRSILLGESGDFTKKLPVARPDCGSHAPAEEGMEGIDVEFTRAASHIRFHS